MSLIELLMNELLKLDAIMADGDVNTQRRMQVEKPNSILIENDSVIKWFLFL